MNSLKMEENSNNSSVRNMELNTNKAGMEGIDKEKINDIILEVSKGSKFYLHKQQRQKQIEEKILKMKSFVQSITPQEIENATLQVDKFITPLEESRDLSRVIVHVDMDAFYAAVEMRDDTSLKEKPMAVGSLGMLSTSNYVARKYGVRAGMPGFIGKKLCPQLVLVEPNFEKYTLVSREIHKIFQGYDPDFRSAGLDEAYLDLTAYINRVKGDQTDFEKAVVIVEQIRSRVFEETKLTASAGIAPNMILAKIASDMNKPNGQFIIEPCRRKIKRFMSALSIRKIWGLGPVSEQQLNAIGVLTCEDIIEKRGLIHLWFSNISSKFFIESAIGIGSTCVKSDHTRKSISVERTFNEVYKYDDLIEKCKSLCEELSEDLKKHDISGRTITLKLKTVDFQIKTRSSSVSHFTSDYRMIFKTASKLLSAEYENSGSAGLRLRLMGVRVSNLNTDKASSKHQSNLTEYVSSASNEWVSCPVCFKQQSSSDARQLTMHIENCLGVDPENDGVISKPEEEATLYRCPVCNTFNSSDLTDFNRHIDACLNHGKIKEILKSDKDCDKKVELGESSKTKSHSESSKTIDSFFKIRNKEESSKPEQKSHRNDSKHRKHSKSLHKHRSRSRERKAKRQRSRSKSPRKNEDFEDIKKSKLSASDSDGRKSKVVEDLDEDVYADFDFYWTNHKRTLNKMFFMDCDYIHRGSKELDDLWSFFTKYQKMQRKRIFSGGQEKLAPLPPLPNFSELDEVPDNYVEELLKRFNVSSLSESLTELYFRAHLYDEQEQKSLPKPRVKEFRYVIKLYIRFCLKQEYNKVKKLRTNQQNLPITKYHDEILRTVKHNQVILVAGDTGCGKSTQVPQYLLRGGFQNIACTQPRRIACISLSKRVSYETLNEYKSEVGYQIRFERNKTKHTRILFLTEGLLLRQVCSDYTLSTYDVVVLDEVHERHLHGDFLLGVIKCLIQNRKDLKVILMSATINIELFTNYFNGAPVIQVPGRLFPIKVNYRPISTIDKTKKTSRIDPDPYIRILQLIDKTIPETEHGDMLIFLSGLAEITTIADAATVYAEQNKRWIILPLHSTLSIAEQDKVFDVAPEGVRKCIISTNIAETSITIDGIRFVVDSGKVKEMNYDTSCKIQKLQEFWVSRASAEQRKGRAGRTGPGTCYRLYSNDQYNEFPAYATPEIQRVPLDTLILQMLAMGLPDPRKFPFLQAPPTSSVENAVISLTEHGALNMDEELTAVGRMLSRLPVDISIGKMLIMGCLFKMVEPALSLASALSIQSPFTNNSYKNHELMTARKPFESDHGDPLTLLNIYNEWLKLKSDPNKHSQKWCRQKGVEEQRFYELTKLRKQFKNLLKDCKFLEDTVLDNQVLTSGERSQRYGEMKQLKMMKRSYHNAPKKRKVLKLNFDFKIGDPVEDDGNDIDIKDVEFRMSHDSKQVQELWNMSANVNSADITILKVIVCSGLYPQVALADDHNSYKSESEQLYHTKLKPFVVLHPMGIFANQPEVLEINDAVTVKSQEFSNCGKLSRKHQLLTYLSLLETTKPYLMTSMRVPAAHTLLLFSNNIDTNKDFSRFVCDGWLEMKLVDLTEGQKLIVSAIEIRDMWEELLHNKLKESSVNDEENSETVDEVQSRKIQQELSGALIDYFHQSKPLFTLRRLLAADIKHLYVGPSDCDDQEEVSELFNWIADIKPHDVKGGSRIKEYLTYNCLNEADMIPMKSIQKSWTCDICGEELLVTVLEKLRHQSECSKNKRAEEKEEIESSKSMSNIVKRPYFCPDCQEELLMTSIQILKHKKNHAAT